MKGYCGCIPGKSLCRAAECEWARAGSAYFARDYPEMDKWRERYDSHISIAKGYLAAGVLAMKEKTMHTPGPWTTGWGHGVTGPTTPVGEDRMFAGHRKYQLVTVQDSFTNSVRGDQLSSVIAVLPERNPGESDANARLIATAPQLLEALERLILIEDEPHSAGCPMTWDGSECSCWIIDALSGARAAIKTAKGD